MLHFQLSRVLDYLRLATLISFNSVLYVTLAQYFASAKSTDLKKLSRLFLFYLLLLNLIVYSFCDIRLEMSEKHLQTGDALPPYNGKLRLYAMRFCPYAERSVLVLNAKNIQYDLVFINLDHKPEWIFNFSPKGTVPALEYEQDKGIFDSNIINYYLDEKYPEISLQSADPLRRAQDKMLVEQFSGAQSAYYTAAFNAQGLQPSLVENYHKGLELLQKELQSRGSKYLNGDEPGLVDYTIWPFLERFEALPLLGQADFAIDKDKYGVLVSYMEAMRNVPAVKSYALAPDTHAKFTESRVKGDANYNMLDTSAVCCMRPRKKKE